MVDLSIQLPDDFLEEEERCGYIVSRKMKEVWAVELDLLSELLRVCNKYDIKIFAAAGTLLGTVRHHGFIPWDDDIDMMLFREDYIRLCRVAETEFKYPYFFQTEYTDPGSLRGHAQLRNSSTTGILKGEFDYKFGFNQGIFIDIFPYDNVPEDEKDLRIHLHKIRRYKRAGSLCSKLSTRYEISRNRLKDKLKMILHFLAYRQFEAAERMFYDKLEAQAQFYNGQISSKIASIEFNPDDKHLLRADFNKTELMTFENINIPVCAGYDRVLRALYGNYMEYVRGSSFHGGVIFDTNAAYTDFFD